MDDYLKKRHRGSMWRTTGIVLVVMVIVFLGTGHSGFATVGEIIPISDISPYPSGVECNGTPQTGTVWRNSETEPYMEVDFGYPDRMVAIVHQDRWSNGSAQSTATFYSDDGGFNWNLSLTPITRCSGGCWKDPNRSTGHLIHGSPSPRERRGSATVFCMAMGRFFIR